MANPSNKLTQEEAAKRLRDRGVELSGIYINIHAATSVICMVCGRKWSARLGNIFNGSGCPDCGRHKSANAMRLTKDELKDWLQIIARRGITMIGEYKGYRNKTQFLCKHGHEWKTNPVNVFAKGRGCPVCGQIKVIEAVNRKKLSDSELHDRNLKLAARGITMVGEFLSTQKKICFRCSNNHEWNAQPGAVFAGMGCRICANIKNGERQRLSEVEVNNRCSEIAKRGITMLGQFSGCHSRTRFRHICGHEWSAIAISVFRGRGCQCCAPYGFQPDKSGLLYYVKVQSRYGEVYKIGVTNKQSVQERFGREFSKVAVIETWYFPNGAEALEMEQDILREHAAARYLGHDILKTGNDELFKRDVLGLDRGCGQLELVA